MIEPQSALQIVTGLTAAGALFAGFAIIQRQYVLKHYQSSLYLAITWFGFFLEALFGSLSKLFNDVLVGQMLLRLSYIALVPAFLGVLGLVDSLYREKIELRRFSVVLLVLGLNCVLLVTQPLSSTVPISYYILVTVGLVMSMASYVIYIRIYKHAPLGLKRSAKINLIGAFGVSFLYVIVNVLESTMPGAFPPISRIFEAGGALTQAMIFARHEQLFYILPFKTQRLLVLDSDSGIAVFSHDWSKKNPIISNEMLSGMLKGMSMIINEAVGKGKVLEFKLARGVLLICHDTSLPFTGILISSRPVKVLNQGLSLFVRRFAEQFKQNLSTGDARKPVGDPTSLVYDCFPFVPQY